MSFVDAKIALEKRLKDSWTRTPIRWPNQPFVVPEDTLHNPQPYVAFVLRNNGGEDIVLGSDSPEWRWTGVVILQIFVPENSGTAILTLYADLIKTIYLQAPRDFQYQNSGIIRLYVPAVQEIGINNGWMQANVVVPFRRDAKQ
jgi:hypothetical protein